MNVKSDETAENDGGAVLLSVVIPCYNEENLLAQSVERVLAIGNELNLEIIIVDDFSADGSAEVIRRLARTHNEIVALYHDRNRGKGAALRTGFAQARGEYIAVHDADLEYDPRDLLRLVEPLKEGRADVVFGSRYLHQEQRRVLYFWHSWMNKTLTMLSNLFTDLDLTDMETCYKVFRREVIQSIEIEEDRFGFEPEIVAKVAQMRAPVYEMGISYTPRTYSEGKKINWKDGVRALYCIFHYNAHRAPLPLQLLIYFFIGAFSAVCNIVFFASLSVTVENVFIAAAVANIMAAGVNFWLCVKILFKHRARWNTFAEVMIYLLVVFASGVVDVGVTAFFVRLGYGRIFSKAVACFAAFAANFIGRRFFVFPEPPLEPY